LNSKYGTNIVLTKQLKIVQLQHLRKLYFESNSRGNNLIALARKQPFITNFKAEGQNAD
jgi:hypothetical protein